jgi:hypothetical protein
MNRNIIPRNVPGLVVPATLDFRFLLDYDLTYMRDRLICDLFVDGMPTGIHSRAYLDDSFVRSAYGSGQSKEDAVREAIARYGEDLRRGILEELVGHGYRRQVDRLQRQVDSLQAAVDHLTRPRWWHFTRLRLWFAEAAAPVPDLYHVDQ